MRHKGTVLLPRSGVQVCLKRGATIDDDDIAALDEYMLFQVRRREGEGQHEVAEDHGNEG